jgi:membrane-associated phospholipid phosphatase
MKISQIRLTQFWSGIRATPVIFGAYAFLNYLNNPSKDSFFLLINVFNLYTFNKIFKIGFKYLYDYLKVSKLPLLGIGRRPTGACNCKTFLSLPNILSTTYGMPSGHSMTAWGVCIYLILNILNKRTNYILNEKLNKIIKVFSILFLVVLATTISYSRVYVENCHTLEQVTVGGILGIVIGILFYYLKEKSNIYDNVISNISNTLTTGNFDYLF